MLRARTLGEVTRARGFGLCWFTHHATDNALQFDIVEARGARATRSRSRMMSTTGATSIAATT